MPYRLQSLAFLVAFCLGGSLSAQNFEQPDPKGFPDLFSFTDTCNSYLIRDGDAALLIDLGDGVASSIWTNWA